MSKFAPSIFKKVVDKMSEKNGLSLSKLEHEDYAPTLTEWKTFQQIIDWSWEEFLNEPKAYKGYQAPDFPIVLMPDDSNKDYVQTQLIKKFARPGVPLVINFGSCT